MRNIRELLLDEVLGPTAVLISQRHLLTSWVTQSMPRNDVICCLTTISSASSLRKAVNIAVRSVGSCGRLTDVTISTDGIACIVDIVAAKSGIEQMLLNRKVMVFNSLSISLCPVT